MGKRRRVDQSRLPQTAIAASFAPAKSSVANLGVFPKPLTAQQKLAFRCIALLLPIVLLVLVELTLRLFGYGFSPRFFVPIKGQEAYTTNPQFGCRFSPKEIATQPYPVIIPKAKAAGTKRIFILGESAAQGTPAPAFGFGRILEVMLQQQHPESRLELFNVAMRGIDSHAIVSIARECSRLQPDAFIIYMGNNEAIGTHAPTPHGVMLPLWLLRTSQWAKDLRIGQLILNTLRKVSGKKQSPEQDMEFFRKHRLAADNPRRAAVYVNFRENLREILSLSQSSGAKVLLCTVAGNVADFPPLGSLHRADLSPASSAEWDKLYAQGIAAETANRIEEAITNYLAAAKLDDHYAELHCRLGRCYRAAGKPSEARQAFEAARDWDALQFRTDGKLNGVIRELAQSAAQPGGAANIRLVDVEGVFTARAFLPDSQSSPPLFHEHVHLTFDGDYLLAQTVFPEVSRTLGLTTNNTAALPTRQQCAQALGLSVWDDANLAIAAAGLTSKPPFLDQLDHPQRQSRKDEANRILKLRLQQEAAVKETFQFYQAAVASRPRDWQLRMNFGMMLNNIGDNKSALREFAEAVKLMPAFASLRTIYAQCLWKAGSRDEARAQLKQALRLHPDYEPARQGLKLL